MTIEYLHEFLVLAETQSFSEAAEQLYMNQSTLSKHIKSLEQELDTNLFERNTRKVVLTKYGTQLLPYAEKISSLNYQYHKELAQTKSNLLSIGAIPIHSQYGFLDLVMDFKKAHPDIMLKLEEEDSAELSKHLIENKYEITFMRSLKNQSSQDLYKQKNINSIHCATDYLAAAVPYGHELCSYDSLTLPALEDHDICLLKENTFLYETYMGLFQNTGIIPKILYTSHRINNILDVCQQTGSIALLVAPEDNKINPYDENFKLIKILPDTAIDLSLCYMADRRLSHPAEEFIQYFTKHFSGKS